MSLTTTAQRWKCSEAQALAMIERHEIETTRTDNGRIYVQDDWVAHWQGKLCRADVRRMEFGDVPEPAPSKAAVGSTVSSSPDDPEFWGCEQNEFDRSRGSAASPGATPSPVFLLDEWTASVQEAASRVPSSAAKERAPRTALPWLVSLMLLAAVALAAVWLLM